jgi:phosphatidate cytidylyltransferase
MAAISNFWQRIITGSIFLLIMIGSIVWSFQSFYLVFGFVLVVATHEYLKLTSKFSAPTKGLLFAINIISYLLVGISLLIEINPSPIYRIIKVLIVSQLQFILTIIFPIIIVVVELLQKKPKPFENIAYSVLGYMYIAIPFILLIQTSYHRVWGYNYQIVLVYFLLLWSADSFAYASGKLIGKHKLAPNISAGKTIEGTIGGIIITAGFSLLLAQLFPKLQFSTIEWIVLALLIAIFAVPSDLSESILKRQAGVKDSGTILPGHGGMLDRFDSVLLTAPIVYLYYNITSLL